MHGRVQAQRAGRAADRLCAREDGAGAEAELDARTSGEGFDQARGRAVDYLDLMSELSLSRDAVTVLGLAGTALPYAQSVDDEVERWLRPLRLYGESGAALQGLGVGETRNNPPREAPVKESGDPPSKTLHEVTQEASRLAAERGATAVGTLDILRAVMEHYGEDFERALESHSGNTAELMDQLAARTASPSSES